MKLTLTALLLVAISTGWGQSQNSPKITKLTHDAISGKDTLHFIQTRQSKPKRVDTANHKLLSGDSNHLPQQFSPSIIYEGRPVNLETDSIDKGYSLPNIQYSGSGDITWMRVKRKYHKKRKIIVSTGSGEASKIQTNANFYLFYRASTAPNKPVKISKLYQVNVMTFRYDTTQIYFQAITGVKNGELKTKWFDGYKVVESAVFVEQTSEWFLFHNKKPVHLKIIKTY